MRWTYEPEPAIRQERHFTDRVMACFEQRPGSPYEAYARAVAQRPSALAVVAGDVRWTYAELDAQVQRAAAGLAGLGVAAGDRVGMLLSNRIEFVTTLLAVLRLGAVAVPMGTRLQTPEIAYITGHSGCRVLVHDAELSARLPGRDALPQLVACVAAGAPATDAGSYDHLVRPGRAAPPVHPGGEDDLAIIVYTSGTTGKPKGAMLTALNLVHSMLNYAASMRMGPDDRTLLAVPASHVTGLIANVMLAWQAQCTLIVMPEFKARTFLELASREGMTHTVLVPAIYNLCLLQPDFERYDLSAWRVGGYGGAPMAQATIGQLAQKLPNLRLHNVYGSTETSGPVTMLPPELSAQRPDSVGFVLPCAEILVMDEDGRQVPPGTAGELWIRGPMVVPGYWDNPEATRTSFVSGFWCSGDIGVIDAEGFVRIQDRVKDMLDRGGFKIYSVEVEDVLQAHPAVVESAIVPRPCPVLGQRVHAYVCLKEGAQVTAEELRAFCAERLADYKVPETYTLTREPLPRNANGKLLKRELREQLAAA